MSQAIFGLLGVVVGALITFGLEWFAERSRERKAAKQAAMLLATELGEKDGFIAACLQFGKWLGDPAEVLSVKLWPEQRSALAASGFKAWQAVDLAFSSIRAVRDVEVAEGTRKGDPIQPPEYRMTLERRLRLIRIASKALRDYAGVSEFDDPAFKQVAAEIANDALRGGWRP